ncbi:hypothetical protein GCM10023216_24100 [Isoptericola chiayiensis]|uniref:Gram-positive cocci surface proteins LPxTG domain-containing protein n=1 Tax=Isoptericola chiayiensis TaxID=579446 RepID=A0ABP8YLM2_9MICO|nr:LPXTG cell wall anchor domain-containing protein [Isoptericola chiayiensis]NOV99646.1 LPXTG-motif cell wall-anchored protein [Isoptericola chiayiensis]
MRTARRAAVRGAAATGLVGALMLGPAAGALADTDPTDDPSASPSETGYDPDTPPTLEFEVLTPLCDGDVPYLQYAVDVQNPETPPTGVTITFLNPGGEDYVLTELPLSGRVLWPGAEVDEDGNPVDWPGWSLVDGVWVVGDEWDWVRPSVQVLFEVNPEATTSVDYPPSSPDCATDPPGETPPPSDPPGDPATEPPGSTESTPPSLPATGSEIAGMIAIAAGLLTAGVLAVLAVRRRRSP